MVNGATSQHPDDDLLADLAADVLPTHQARAVEAHVMVCGRCTALLTDAAQVRELLLADDPGPVPPEVLARIDQALRIEAAARDGAAEYPPPVPPTQSAPYDLPRRQRHEPTPAPRVRVISPWEDTTTIEAYEAARKRRDTSRRPSDESEGAAASVGTGAAAGTPAGPARPGRGPRLTRPTRGPSRSRRDVRQEVRDVKVGRRGTVLGAAAGIVVLLGLGGYVVVGLLGNRNTQTATSAASQVESADRSATYRGGSSALVLATGTNYTQAALKQQATALVSRAASGTVPSPAAPTPAATAAGGAAAAPTADAGNEALRNPATLNGCLAALRAGGRRPVAVDLARYDGRDAAIIVLNGENGGYEVWAVTRDCRPGADGTLTYLDLTH